MQQFICRRSDRNKNLGSKHFLFWRRPVCVPHWIISSWLWIICLKPPHFRRHIKTAGNIYCDTRASLGINNTFWGVKVSRTVCMVNLSVNTQSVTDSVQTDSCGWGVWSWNTGAFKKKCNHSPWATSTPVTCNHIVSLFYVLSTKQYKNSILKPKKPSVTKAAVALNINTRSREQMTGAEQKTTRLLLRQCSLSDRMTAGTVINTALSTGTQHVWCGGLSHVNECCTIAGIHLLYQNSPQFHREQSLSLSNNNNTNTRPAAGSRGVCCRAELPKGVWFYWNTTEPLFIFTFLQEVRNVEGNRHNLCRTINA